MSPAPPAGPPHGDHRAPTAGPFAPPRLPGSLAGHFGPPVTVAGARPTPTSRRTASPLAVIVALAAVVAYVAWLMWALQEGGYDVWGGLLALPVLVAVAWPLVRRAARSEPDPWVARLIVVAFFAKVAGTVPRYWMVHGLYGGGGDSRAYHEYGTHFGDLIRALDWGAVEVARQWPGTGFIDLVTGVVYAVTGPAMLSGFFVFSLFGFAGLVLCYKAARLALPGLDHRRYAVLVLFAPTLLFWPSSIGKDAWMVLTIGITAYGAARLLTHQRGAFAVLALGLLGTSMVRPHITLALFLALVVAYVLRRSPRVSALAPVAKATGIVALLGLGTLVLARFEEYFDIDETRGDTVEQVLSEAERRTGQGGSEFQAHRPRHPGEWPWTAVTVLYRPFPHEAHNSQALVTSLEAMGLLLLTVVSWRRMLVAVRQLTRHAYLAMALLYTAGFCYAFAAVGNFGILARQRAQVLPFFLVLLCMPATAGALRGRREEVGRAGAPG